MAGAARRHAGQHPQQPRAQGHQHSEDRPDRQRRHRGDQDSGDHGRSQVTTTPDHPRGAMLRAYDKKTGKEVGAVWMPAPQSGSPMTYIGGWQAVHHRRRQRRQLLGRIHRVRAAAVVDALDGGAVEVRTQNSDLKI